MDMRGKGMNIREIVLADSESPEESFTITYLDGEDLVRFRDTKGRPLECVDLSREELEIMLQMLAQETN